MEDKLATLIGLRERLLQAQSAVHRAQLHPGLVEAMERFERDLPLTTEHVARLLDVSERTVRRIVPIAARSEPGGTVWYSRREVEAVWLARVSSNTKRGSKPRRGLAARPRSSIVAPRAADKVASDDLNVSAVEERLRRGLQEKPSDRRILKLRLMPHPSPDSPAK
jgi:hypothetical protein